LPFFSLLSLEVEGVRVKIKSTNHPSGKGGSFYPKNILYRINWSEKYFCFLKSCFPQKIPVKNMSNLEVITFYEIFKGRTQMGLSKFTVLYFPGEF